MTRDQILFLTAALAYRMEQMRAVGQLAEGVTKIVVTDEEEESE